MWRHVVVVGVISILLVFAIMYCITPDALDATFSLAGKRVRQLLGSASISGMTAALSERVSGSNPVTPSSGERVAAGQPEPAGERSVPDPFQPHSGPLSRARMGAAWVIRRIFEPQAVGGLLFLISGLWVGKRIRSRWHVRAEKKMAAGLAKALRRSEDW